MTIPKNVLLIGCNNNVLIQVVAFSFGVENILSESALRLFFFLLEAIVLSWIKLIAQYG